MVRVVYFDYGEGEKGKLLVVIHHLVVDGVSWRILLEDLLAIISSHSENEKIILPSKTTSYKKWAEIISIDQSVSAFTPEELNYWQSLPEWDESKFSPDIYDGKNSEGSVEIIRTNLGERETRYLIREVNQAFGTEIQDILLAALSLTFLEFSSISKMVIDIEGHGRQLDVAGVDLSRTVGWFTIIYPVALHVPQTRNYGEVIKSVKEQIRKIPHAGKNYHLYKEYMIAHGEKVPTSRISFNYLGQIDGMIKSTNLFQLTDEWPGASHSPNALRSYWIDIVLVIRQGQLHIEWLFSRNLFKHTRMTNLASLYVSYLKKLILFCISPNNSGYTPSDFPDISLTDDEIDALISEINSDSE
jgi:non-ribosomal peptide synthase protein (TIGR01720 family)